MAIDMTYQGPPQEYKSYIDTISDKNVRKPSGYGTGYADIDFLLKEVTSLSQYSKQTYDICVLEMNSYTLMLDTSDTHLIQAHQMSYPDDDTPDSISFAEYIYNFSASQSTSSQYVNKYYENKVRGIYGTNALDVAHITRVIYSETKRILDFLAKYTGDIDDPSEFRIIEAFQNWVQDTKNILSSVRQILSQKAVTQIPEVEMAQLDEGKSKEFQGLFQSKLNIINSAISDLISQLYKDWDSVSDVFYNKILGPSLKFVLNVSNKITNGINSSTAPVLYQEAAMTTAGLNSQFDSALSDQVKRNHLFYEYAMAVIQNMLQRDAYVKYLDQLSSKGTVIPNPFMLQIQEEPTIVAYDLDYRPPQNYADNASSSHDYLTGREEDDAHPQYLLNSGGTIEGELFLTGDMTVNGAKVSDIFHVKDGVPRIPSYSIDWDSINTGELGTAGETVLPYELYVGHKRVLDGGKIEYTIDFEVDNESSVNYEFEIIEL